MSLNHILAKVRDAAANDGPGGMSTGEALMAALVLNRPDWLAKMDYTIGEAIDRVGAEWAGLIPKAAKIFEEEQARNTEAEKAACDALTLTAAKARRESASTTLDCSATLVTQGGAPGYRDATFVFDLLPLGCDSSFRVSMRVCPEDGESMVAHLREVHQLAWNRGSPLDARPGEMRPHWVSV